MVREKNIRVTSMVTLSMSFKLFELIFFLIKIKEVFEVDTITISPLYRRNLKELVFIGCLSCARCFHL